MFVHVQYQFRLKTCTRILTYLCCEPYCTNVQGEVPNALSSMNRIKSGIFKIKFYFVIDVNINKNKKCMAGNKSHNQMG